MNELGLAGISALFPSAGAVQPQEVAAQEFGVFGQANQNALAAETQAAFQNQENIPNLVSSTEGGGTNMNTSSTVLGIKISTWIWIVVIAGVIYYFMKK